MTHSSSTRFHAVRRPPHQSLREPMPSIADTPVAIGRPARAGSMRPGRPFSSTARTRRAIHRGQAALSRADVNTAETAGRWALSRLPDPTAIEPGTLSLDDRELLLAGLELVAQARRDLVDLTAAAHLHHQALTLLSGAPETHEKDREQSIVLTRLAETLRLLGRYADADRRHREALALAERLQPADPVLVASALNGLGVVLQDTRQYAHAAWTYHRALALAEAHLGPDDPHLAGLLHNLAGLDLTRHRYTVGEPKARRALHLRVWGDGPDSTGTAGDLAVLGALLLGQGPRERGRSHPAAVPRHLAAPLRRRPLRGRRSPIQPRRSLPRPRANPSSPADLSTGSRHQTTRTRA